MFQTAVITDEVSQDFQIAVDFALRHGLDAVEIRSVEEKNPFDMVQADIDKMKAILEGTNLKVCCIINVVLIMNKKSMNILKD